jgi:hypothetical protein
MRRNEDVVAPMRVASSDPPREHPITTEPAVAAIKKSDVLVFMTTFLEERCTQICKVRATPETRGIPGVI